MPKLALMQRGEPVVVQRDEYEYAWTDALRVLADHKVLKVRLRGDHVLVYPGPYVGSARSSTGGLLRIKPRYPALLDALRRAFPLHHRNVPLDGFVPSGQVSQTNDHIVCFLQTAADVVDEGVPFAYESRRFDGVSPSGHLDIGETIKRFASRGIHHRVATRRAIKTTDPELVELVWSTSIALQDEDELSPQEAESLELMLEAFGPPRHRHSRSDSLQIAESVAARFTDRPKVRDVAAACAAVLARSQTLEDVEAVTDSVSFSFTDADALWERAVHFAMNAAAAEHGWTAHLHPLRGVGQTMFQDGGPVIDPDVLVTQRLESPVIVVDAKDFAQSGPESSGVYQVLAYARALRVGHAALIYLTNDEGWLQQFGDEQVRIYATGICPTGPNVLERLQSSCRSITEAVISRQTI